MFLPPHHQPLVITGVRVLDDRGVYIIHEQGVLFHVFGLRTFLNLFLNTVADLGGEGGMSQWGPKFLIFIRLFGVGGGLAVE